ncbi:N-acyl homoserine lactonase family protein [Allobranchiibius sp. CTAmp26]|uniref:N-acyl homoserine lactonase family protein n=1 Tax=Allobranchiibius sp. CTAmp26 TaxID=2815214 RepID=UPI001AA13B01|nr:N-acyl homoserine lactonase family protein [Allobranchiibius sp. CTAmp26]MBO1753637.1 N-acyl homoserine lactonase family protein [Allobranchiibius sp. CTAmp26]
MLDLGSCDCTASTVAPGSPDMPRLQLPVSAYLIRLVDGAHLLVDTGMHRGHVDDPDLAWRGTVSEGDLRGDMTSADTLTHRLGELGLTPPDVAYVVNTHLHFDHAGDNDLFPHARFLVQRAQVDFARDNPDYPGRFWDLPQLAYELLDGPADIAPGVRVLPTPGHTPGHQSVVVTLPQTGTVILAGDAVHIAQSFERDDWSAHHDPAAARRSAYELRDLADSTGGLLIYGHDRSRPQSLRLAPHASYS